MRSNHKTHQRGQAMTEFLAAMAVFVPLFFGIVYIGKYQDIKHQAIQASRYAAMQRALDPHGNQSDQAIRREMTARFFRDSGRYAIRRDDQAPGPASSGPANGDLNPNWYTVNGDAMIKRYDNITLDLHPPRNAIGGAGIVALNTASRAMDGLERNFGVAADVRVPVADILHFEPLANAGLTIGATTVVAGDSWSANGAKGVADHIGFKAVPARAASFLNSITGVLRPLFDLLGAPPPQLGCLKPDVVPNAATNGASYDPGNDSPASGSVDECL